MLTAGTQPCILIILMTMLIRQIIKLRSTFSFDIQYDVHINFLSPMAYMTAGLLTGIHRGHGEELTGPRGGQLVCYHYYMV